MSKMIRRTFVLCECGCQTPLPPGRRFVTGHQNKTGKARESHSKPHPHYGGKQTLESNIKRSMTLKGRQVSKETSQKLKESMKKLWQDPVFREERLKKAFVGICGKPNKPEKLVNSLLQNLFPGEYKYVGDGQFIIGGKFPDFINVNGQKKIIELFGDYWHGEKRTGRTKEEEEQKRMDIFCQYGYKTLIIWQRELKNLPELTNKIIQFSQEGKLCPK
jgi:very-short-patch-repair endonuclease